MGAVAPVYSWIPEDDLLLKNAVEGGASLESLAKGAVHFSRRFTVQELQDRWFSLLYDPVVSAEASARMIEFERSASTLPSKSNRLENSGKRKAESVRKCYYAMRKRICNEPLESTNLGFLVASGNGNCNGNGDEASPAIFILADPTSNHVEVQDPNIGITHPDFPEFEVRNAAGPSDGVTANTFSTEFQNPAEDIPVDQNNMHDQIPRMFRENLPPPGGCSLVDEAGQPNDLPASGLFKSGDLVQSSSASFDQGSDHLGNMCSGFGGSPVFNSPMTDCDASFHHLGYSSPLPQMPIWSAFEAVPAPTMPDVNLSENKNLTGDTFPLPVDNSAINADTSGYGFTDLDSRPKSQVQCDNLKNTTFSSDDYFAELSNTLLNFTEGEELLFLDDDGKDGIDKAYIDGLSSLLLDSPRGDDVPDVTEMKAPVAASNEYIGISGGACSAELGDCEQSHYGDGCTVCSSDVQVPTSSSTANPRFPELHNEIIYCTLNTEDMEIPSNDDVFLPIRMPPPSLPSLSEVKFHEVNKPTSLFVEDFFYNQKNKVRSPSQMKREGKNPEKSCSPKMTGTRLLPEVLNHPVCEPGVKFELPNSEYPNVVFKSASTVCKDPDKISLAAGCASNPLPGTLKEEAKEIECMDSYQEKPVCGYPGGNASCCKQEVSDPAVNQNHQEKDYMEMTIPDMMLDPSVSEEEELSCGSDGDMPYFSDVEAMILDGDLSPDDRDLYTTRAVLRYQHEDSKRTIIRLEQAAHSYMQRDIASRGACAVLYGRHSKHYIKRSEVLLGRATEDTNVDIDLGREGRANKISRRQAIIKMDKSGSFHLKNLGKCSIFVNNKEVAPGQAVILTSSCLVEIRGISFIFETNQTCVKQYLDNTTKESQNQEQKV